MMQPGGPWPLPQSAMRAAQADRERTVDVLKAAFAEGRLTTDEYHDRSERAQHAQTYGQLQMLVQDLPVGPMPTPMLPPPPVAFAAPPRAPLGPMGMASAPIPPYGYAPPAWPPVRRRTNGPALASLLLGLGQVFSFGVTGVPALICGIVAKGQLKVRDEEGDGMATAGIILGSLGTLLWGFFFLLAATRG
ncbi:DUF1707 and DUF4190 domain-containing protein [Streptacidiphilus sp. MAP12-33]|uniref:DUF1707 and DUF4190 domain-containing protein n=1 Tax=Streptacidiphilus sp. MAP12-33 TaxID=3156266 RepID=UPI0035130A58